MLWLISRLSVFNETGLSAYGMSLIEFDGYFEGKFEPVKYTRVEVHTVTVDENDIVKYANTIRSKLKQESLALEFNNKFNLLIKNERNS